MVFAQILLPDIEREPFPPAQLSSEDEVLGHVWGRRGVGAQAMSEESLATKADFTPIERELSVVKWMTSAIVAGVVSLLLKSFAG